LSNLVGLISDTHGLIRPEALDALRDSDLIIHCGDVGNPAVLDMLRSIAPVRAVRGNNDTGAWARGLPLSDTIEIGSHKIYVLHNLSEFDLDPDTTGFTAVVFGHSHKPVIERQGRTLFINPGSAGARRFKLPTTVATLTIGSRRCVARILPLPLSK
jgi:putative phosphoesterase